MDGGKRFKYAMCGRVFFLKKTEKKNTVSVFTNIRIRVDRAL